MPEWGKKKQNFHINLLMEFHHRAESGATQLFVRVVSEEEEPTKQYFPTDCTIDELMERLGKTNTYPLWTYARGTGRFL